MTNHPTPERPVADNDEVLELADGVAEALHQADFVRSWNDNGYITPNQTDKACIVLAAEVRRLQARASAAPACDECGAALRCAYDWHHKAFPASPPADERPPPSGESKKSQQNSGPDVAAELQRLRLALAGYNKHPEECVGEDGTGACASHMAYSELVMFLEREGYIYDDDAETWARSSTTPVPSPTAGPFVAVHTNDEKHMAWVARKSGKGDSILIGGNEANIGTLDPDEANDRADFVADALNVRHATKLTPSALLNKLRELEAEQSAHAYDVLVPLDEYEELTRDAALWRELVASASQQSALGGERVMQSDHTREVKQAVPLTTEEKEP